MTCLRLLGAGHKQHLSTEASHNLSQNSNVVRRNVATIYGCPCLHYADSMLRDIFQSKVSSRCISPLLVAWKTASETMIKSRAKMICWQLRLLVVISLYTDSFW